MFRLRVFASRPVELDDETLKQMFQAASDFACFGAESETLSKPWHMSEPRREVFVLRDGSRCRRTDCRAAGQHSQSAIYCTCSEGGTTDPGPSLLKIKDHISSQLRLRAKRRVTQPRAAKGRGHLVARRRQNLHRPQETRIWEGSGAGAW